MSAPNGTEASQTPVKTETSPLKEDGKKRCFNLPNLFFNLDDSVGDNSGSLKTIVVILFGTTVAITLALLTQVYYGEYQVQPHGSVSTDSYECSNIGVDVLKKGGNAVDAAIAATFCLCVVNFHVTGLGGGGYLMIYNHRKHRVIDVLDFHESVPIVYDMEKLNDARDGYTVGVPGLVRGLWDAHQKYGKLPWKNLVMPAADLANNGFKIKEGIMAATAYLKTKEYNSNLIKFMNLLKEGESFLIPDLAATLELIASKGAEVFYNGSIAMDIIYSVKLAHGNMSLSDLSLYKSIKSDVLRARIGDFDVFVPGSSSGGALLLNALDLIQILDLNEEVDTPPEIILKMSDILHDSYVSFLQKSDAYPEQPDAVGSQVSAVDCDETYVTTVTGLNTWLGSQILTSSGFILNNAITRGGFNGDRRPISLASPVIAVQRNEVCGRRFTLGSGDVTMAAQVLTNLLILNKNISVSVESPRYNVDNKPRHLKLEEYHSPKFSLESIEKLKQWLTIEGIQPPYKSINVVGKVVDSIMAYADSRGEGFGAQFK